MLPVADTPPALLWVIVIISPRSRLTSSRLPEQMSDPKPPKHGSLKSSLIPSAHGDCTMPARAWACPKCNVVDEQCPRHAARPLRTSLLVRPQSARSCTQGSGMPQSVQRWPRLLKTVVSSLLMCALHSRNRTRDRRARGPNDLVFPGEHARAAGIWGWQGTHCDCGGMANLQAHGAPVFLPCNVGYSPEHGFPTRRNPIGEAIPFHPGGCGIHMRVDAYAEATCACPWWSCQ
jgi:hypothetical protein